MAEKVLSIAGLATNAEQVALKPVVPSFPSEAEMVCQEWPSDPVRCLHSEPTIATAQMFENGFKGNDFKGKVFYAVKANSNPWLLHTLYEAGTRHFDVASLDEIKLVHSLGYDDVRMAYMNPVKDEDDIRHAYFDYGIRDFSLDDQDELETILEHTKAGFTYAPDLNLHVRIAIPNDSAKHDLSGKFGIEIEDAAAFLKIVDAYAAKTGVCFHVGSQTMETQSFSRAIEVAGKVVKESGIKLDILDVGGGFPAQYPDMSPPPMQDFFRAIATSITALNLPKECEIWCEPGRALATPSESLVVEVVKRKARQGTNWLYINDGRYGQLHDGSIHNVIWPMEMLNLDPQHPPSENLIPFSLYGPTCDSDDKIVGPYYLPENIKKGDYLVIRNMGAYGAVMCTDFNGFWTDHQVEISPTRNDNNVIPMKMDAKGREPEMA